MLRAEGEKMSDTVILGFTAKSATLHTGFSKELSNTPSISYRLEHEKRQKVSTAEGVDLTDLEWTMQIHGSEKYNEHVEEKGGIGVMKYWDTRGTCHISASIGGSSFNRLSRATHLPTQIAVHVHGLKYGTDYEGADMIWPQTDEASIVTEVAFSISMGDVPHGSISATPKNEMLEVVQQAIRPLYVIAVAVVLIALKLYFL